MTTNLKTVREAVQTKLLAIGSTGYSFLDLRAVTVPDGVKVGHYSEPWASGQQACLWLVKAGRNPGPTLVGQSQVATFGLLIWFPVASDDPEIREDGIEAAWVDLTKRFRAQTDRTLGGIALDTALALDDHLGVDATHGTELCVIAVTVTVTYREDLP